MAFPTSPVTGTVHTTSDGTQYSFTANGGWALVDPVFDINALPESAAINGAADYFVWYDVSLGAHRKIKINDFLALNGSTPVSGGGGGVSLI